MCTYNGASFIEEQLDSLASQTHLPCEVILCDDMSADGTIEIADRLAASFAFPIRIHVNAERLGYRKNFMKAASLCSGDLVAFCDQDDIWVPEKLAVVSEAFSDPGVLMVHHNARLVRADGEAFGRIDEEGAYPALSEALAENPWHYCLGFTQTFRRDLVEFNDLRGRILGEGETEWTAHDQWISFLSSALGRVAYIDRELVDYRQHDRNTYGASRDQKRPRIVDKIVEKLFDYRDYNILKRVCARRASVLKEIAASGSGSLRDSSAARLAESWYAALSGLYEVRADCYAKASPVERLSAWMRLIRMGGYAAGSGDYHFTRRSAARDLVQGVLFASLRHGTAPTADFSLRISPKGAGDSRRQPMA